jgi:hypothetical protein
MIFDEQDLVKTLNKADFSPTVMAGISIATTLIGTGITAYGQAQQGKTANKLAQRNAQIMNRNATIAQQNAEFNAKLKEREDRRKRAGQEAGLQASGIEIYDGTNLIAFADQEWTDEINAELIRRGGQNEAANLQMQAGVTIAEGQAAKSAGYTSAGGSLLTGMGSAGMDYAIAKKTGIFK